jgi:hypothetical protein
MSDIAEQGDASDDKALSDGDAANHIRDRWCKHVNYLQAAQLVHAPADAELACAWAHAHLVYSVFPPTRCEL